MITPLPAQTGLQLAAEVLSIIKNFSISPMAELMFWGVLTSGVLAYVIINCVTSEEEEPGCVDRITIALVFTVLWCINASTWFFGAIKWMVFSDLIFASICGLVWAVNHYRWAKRLTILGGVAFLLTVGTWYDVFGYFTLFEVKLNQYAVFANIVYTCQLFIISGWKQSEPKEDNHAFDTARFSTDILGEPNLR